MRTSIKYAVPLALASLLILESGGANAAAIFDDVAAIRQVQPAGQSFNQELAGEYRKLAVYEADEMYDWIDAENHATKGMAAVNGTTPKPSDPQNWDIETAAHMSELTAARASLVAILDDGARSKTPHEAAVAQASYDCWVEQQEEGHQPTHIAACRDRFMAAFETLKTAMANAEPAVTRSVAEVARETVYFEFDDAGVTPAAQKLIDSFVAEMKQIEDVTLFIVGYADKSGADAYNMDLSARRAAAVRAELDRQGMTTGDVEDLEIAAEGEQNPAVDTPDGVRHPLNRRVEIVAQGMVTTTSGGQTAARTE